MAHAVVVLVGVLAVGVAVVALLIQRWPLTVAAVAGATLSGTLGRFDRSATIDGLDAVVFVAAMVLVAAAAERSGLLAALADGLARRVRGRLGLLLATFVAGVLVTTFLNLDTTAVLFTPLALSIAAAGDRNPVPFALAALAAANFGSMLLPTSNLTNLVLWRHGGRSYLAFAASLAPVALVALVIVAVALAIVDRGRRRDGVLARSVVVDEQATDRGPVDRPAADRSIADRSIADRRLAVVSGAVVGGLVSGLTLGAPVVVAAPVGAAVVLVVRRSLWRERLPMVLAVAVVALFVAAGSLRRSVDIGAVLPGTSATGLALAGALLANVGSNLTSVLLLQPLASDAAAQRALLVGVNLGAGITPIGSLATILWRDALRRRRAEVSWATFAAFSCPLSAVLLVAALLAVR